ncbi:hypothetical protein [Clostridium sp. E02]|uniref:hypothetical protein n=1 Tax=Clostridium sp. E02 TaxID=2487134 RepID=UPI001FAA5961|nr:hypothetical protein [Clostridium sp. E02]
MAEKRMFSVKIIDSDAFLDMPLSTQALYFHLSMRADDDGFLNNAKKIMRNISATQNDYDLLLMKRFIIQFPDGICVIKHWRINNYLRKDRYTETLYGEEMAMLDVKENGSYSLKGESGIPKDNHNDTDMIPVRNQGIPSGDTDKNREEKSSKEKNIVQEAHALFENLWMIYPLKRGKGQVSNTAKKRILDIGYDQMERAINRYKADLEKDTWRKPQNGSTFFNSGYVDYLDCNYPEESSQDEVVEGETWQ